MSVETIDLVRDTTMQEISASLAAIANNTGGLVIKGWRNVQALVRSGVAKRVFHKGDQFIVERETAMNATVGNTDGETAGITAATVNADTFIAEIGTAHNGDYEFIYDGAGWHLNGEPVSIAAYGITVTGTPRHGDAVVVHETAAKMLVTVLGVDQDTPADPQLEHSLTVGFQDCYAELQFDAREALFAFPDGLATGSYTFTIKAHNWVPSDVNKSLTFTLTQAIPKGGQLVVSQAYNASFTTGNISSYASSSTTEPIETVKMNEGDIGTSLGDVTNAIVDNTNSCQRALLGSNRWSTSALKQLLNSDKAAGTFWKAQTVFDRPPSWAANTAGFLYGMDPDFVSVIGRVNKRTALNTVSDGGGYEDSVEKVFLLSRSEVYAGKENNIDEGGPYDYFKDFSDFSAPSTGKDTNRIKYRNGAAKYWWLRSPDTGNARNVRNIYPSGELYYYYATNSYGVAPACCIV